MPGRTRHGSQPRGFRAAGPRQRVVVVVVVLGLLEVAEPELMSLLVPELEPVAAPEAPIEVPLPVLEPAVVSVLPLVLPGDVLVEGGVLEVVEPVPASSRLPQALSDRAAIRARAAHCAIGDLIIGKTPSRFRFEMHRAMADSASAACGSL
jgi:hypothetical protein